MKRLCLFILLALFIFTANLHSQKQRFFPKVTPAGKGIVNTRVDNLGYWDRMMFKGYVEREPYYPVKKAIFTTSNVFLDGRFIQDSPDILITDLANTTQSENSIFISPVNEDIILNSNNSSDTNWTSGITFFGADHFYSEDAALSWGGSITGAGGSNSGDPVSVIGLNGWWYVGKINNAFGQSVAYSTDEGQTWTDVLVAPGGGGDNILDKNHLWIDNQPSSPYAGYLYDAWTNFITTSPNYYNVEISRSSTNGTTWTTPLNISAEVNAGSHNHGVNIHTGPNGEVYVVWSIYDTWPLDENALGFSKSINGGAVFTPAIRIIDNLKGIRYESTSKAMRVNSFPCMAVDVSGGLYHGNIYVVFSNIGVPGINTGNDIDIFMIRSSDEGETWSAPIRVNQDPPGLGKEHFFPWITCDPENGNLCVVYYDDRNVNPDQCETWISWSNDGGNTWSDLKVSDVVFTPSPIPGLAAGYFGDYIGITSKNMKVYPCWTDNRSGRALTYVSPINLGPSPNQSYIVYESYDLSSMTGQTGKPMNSGDSLNLSLGLKNIGDLPATDIMAFLSSGSPYITITDSIQIYGSFSAGEIKVVPNGYSFKVSDSIPDGLRVRFDIRATNDDSTWYSHFGIESHAPALTILPHTIDDSLYGNNDHHPDPGETITIRIPVKNSGDLDCISTTGMLNTAYQYLSFVNSTVYLDTIRPGEIKYASFDAVISDEATTGSAFTMNFFTESGFYHRSATIQEMIGLIVEDWETNSFSKFPWSFGGDKDWIIDSILPFEGRYCAKSGRIFNLQSTELKVVYKTSVDDTISFFRKVSCEKDYDVFSFFVDSILVDSWSGNVPWGRVAYPVTAGNHLFKWKYIKDVDISSGQDRAWIDYVEFPPPLLPTVSAGPFDTICAGEVYHLQGTAEDYDSIQWISFGDGTFSDPAIPDPFYTPGENDISDGTVRLKIMAYNENGISPAFMDLAIHPVPEIKLTVIPNDTVCSWQTIYLSSNATGAETYLWIPGDFTTPDITADISTVGTPGSWWFRVTATNEVNCSVTDSLLIHFKDCLGIEDYGPAFISEVYPVPNNGIFQLTIYTKKRENIGIRLLNSLNIIVYEDKNWFVSGKVSRLYDFTRLPAGVYFLELLRKEGKTVQKVLIQK